MSVGASSRVNKTRQNLPLLPYLVGDILQQVKSSYEKNKKLTDADLLKLHSVYGAPLEKALDLLDKNCATFFGTQSGLRYVVQVVGSTGIPYTLFPKVNYCSCPAYNYNVIKTRTYLTCKHVLVAYLAELLGKGRHIEVTDDQLIQMLSTIANLQTDDN